MTKVDIRRLDSVTTNDTTATQLINENFEALQEAIENTISRDGTTPNFMDADLDLNSYKIINAGTPTNNTDVITKEYFDEHVGDAAGYSAAAEASANRAAQSAQAAQGYSTAAAGAADVAQRARDFIESDPGFVAVSTDLAAGDNSKIKQVAANKTNIDTVADISTDVTTVSNIASDISAVEDISADVSAVAADLTNIDSVAEDLTNINSVAGDLTNIDAVNANKTNIDTVAGINSNVTTVAGIASDVTAVANNNIDISTVASDLTNIDTVAGDLTNINAVAADLTNIDNASSYAAEAKQWAVGDPSEPSAGSAKYWAGQAAAGQVQADWTEADTTAKSYIKNKPSTMPSTWGNITGTLSNQTDLQNALNLKQDVATAVNYDNISNCITEIPQDIKLELNNGTLTLKAGSKVYVPNGVGVFDTYTFTEDKTATYTALNNAFGFVYRTASNNIEIAYVGFVHSGDSAPSGATYMLWYDIVNNLVKKTTDGGNTWISGYSLPIALVYGTTSGLTVIDQVFNGFGYIGSTIFALPGVKGLIPNGRNADGSLKNTEFTTSNVLTADIYNGEDIALVISANYLGRSSDVYYYEDENYVRTPIGRWNQCLVEKLTCENNSITSFTPKTAFHAVDYNDFKEADDNNVKLTGDQTIAGTKTFTSTPTIKMTQPNLYMQYTGISKGTAPTSTTDGWFGTVYDKNGTAQTNKMAQIYHDYNSNGVSTLNLAVFEPTSGSTNNAKLIIGYDQNKNVFTYAPTPATSDNSTKIATTAFVVNVLKEIYPVGSVYIGTMSTCPLAALFGTWTLKSAGRVLQGADSNHLAGSTISAGLPNITGSVDGGSGTLRWTSDYTQEGALDVTLQNNSASGGSNTGISAFTFDASKSNSIYGNSTTVQPPAYVVNIWERTA